MTGLFPLDLRELPGAALLARVREQTSPQLAALASRLARAFMIDAPSAPGFCCVGGEIVLEGEAAQAYEAARLSVTGNGETLEQALIACLGEAADRLAQIGRADDVRAGNAARNRVRDGWVAQVVPPGADAFDWMSAQDAANGSAVALLADLCIRRPPARRAIKSAAALSIGVAAGPDFEAAALRAALELCERDAAALWWIGGQRPRAFSLEHPANRVGGQLIAALRQDRTDRETRLLDITTELEIPAIAAVSLDRDGCGLACGLAARLDWGEAARASILEMCQMELAAPLAQAKRLERGEAALNEIDLRHLQRAAFAASRCDLLTPSGPSSPETKVEATADPLRALVSRLADRAVRLFVIDLTRPDIEVPVARMVSPDLQPYTADVVTERLSRCRAMNGEAGTAPVPLM